MREKIFTYNNKEYKVTLGNDHGFQTLRIYERIKIFGISFWSKQEGYLWDFIDEDKNMNPIEFAMEILKVKERQKNEKEEYEKKLDEWFA